MSEKATCPGCNSYTSSVLAAIGRGDPCPYCGLSADAILEIHRVQVSQADTKLKNRITEVLKENSALKIEIANLRTFHMQVVGDIEELRDKEANHER